MQKALFEFISYNIDKNEEIQKINQVFKSWDKSGDGILSKDELFQGLASLPHMNITHEEFEDLFNSIDINHDNKIQYSEFLAASLKFQTKSNSILLRQIFDFLYKVSIKRIMMKT